MNTASVAAKIQAQMGRFSGKLSAGLPKVAARLVGEVIFGVQSRGSVRLSEIGRALDLPVALKKVIERLGRQLERPSERNYFRSTPVRRRENSSVRSGPARRPSHARRLARPRTDLARVGPGRL